MSIRRECGVRRPPNSMSRPAKKGISPGLPCPPSAVHVFFPGPSGVRPSARFWCGSPLNEVLIPFFFVFPPPEWPDKIMLRPFPSGHPCALPPGPPGRTKSPRRSPPPVFCDHGWGVPQTVPGPPAEIRESCLGGFHRACDPIVPTVTVKHAGPQPSWPGTSWWDSAPP